MTTLSFPDSNCSNVIVNPSGDHIEAALYSIPTDGSSFSVRISYHIEHYIITRHVSDDLYSVAYNTPFYVYTAIHHLPITDAVRIMQKFAKRQKISKETEWEIHHRPPSMW